LAFRVIAPGVEVAEACWLPLELEPVAEVHCGEHSLVQRGIWSFASLDSAADFDVSNDDGSRPDSSLASGSRCERSGARIAFVNRDLERGTAPAEIAGDCLDVRRVPLCELSSKRTRWFKSQKLAAYAADYSTGWSRMRSLGDRGGEA